MSSATMEDAEASVAARGFDAKQDLISGAVDTVSGGELGQVSRVDKQDKEAKMLRKSSAKKLGGRGALGKIGTSRSRSSLVSGGSTSSLRSEKSARGKSGGENAKLEEFYHYDGGEIPEASNELLAKMAYHLGKRMRRIPEPAQRSWFRLFALYDRDGTGLLDWDEFRTMVRKDLKISLKDITDLELRSLWVACDANAGGRKNDHDPSTGGGAHRIQAWEFAAFMRRCDKVAKKFVVEKVAAKMAQRLEAMEDPNLRMWGPLFDKYDTDSSHLLDRREFFQLVRTDLKMNKKETSDEELDMLWGAVDDDDSGLVTVPEFTDFMDVVTGKKKEMVSGGAQEKMQAGSGVLGTSEKTHRDADIVPRMNKQFQRIRQAAVNKVREPGFGDHGLLDQAFYDRSKMENGSSGASKRFHSPMAAKLKNSKLEELDEAEHDRLMGQEASPQLLARLSHLLEDRMLHFPDPAQRSWMRLFALYDRDNSGAVDWDEFRTMLRKDLKCKQKDVSDEDMKMLWCAVDFDRSGRVAAFEFAAFMRMCAKQANILAIGEIADDLIRAMESLPNMTWDKLFQAYDDDGSTLLGPDEFEDMVRNDLALTHEELDDAGLRSLWNAVDADRSGHVSATEFSKFMRSCHEVVHGEAPPDKGVTCGVQEDGSVIVRMNKQFERRLASSQLHTQTPVDHGLLGDPPTFNDWEPIPYKKSMPTNSVKLNKKFEGQLVSTKKRIKNPPDNGLCGENRGNGGGKRFFSPIAAKLTMDKDDDDGLDHKDGVASPELLAKLSNFLGQKLKSLRPELRSWFRLFSIYDRDSSGGIDFDEFRQMLRKDLKVKAKQLPDTELRQLWATVDNDDSNRLSAFEFAAFIRKCDAHARTFAVAKTARKLIDGLHKLENPDYRNWNILFMLEDKDGSTLMDRKEFDGMIRNKMNITDEDCNAHELGALWNAIDVDSSGHVSAQEFVKFMHNVQMHLCSLPGSTEVINPDDYRTPKVPKSSAGHGQMAEIMPKMTKAFERRMVAGQALRDKAPDSGLLGWKQVPSLDNTGRRFATNSKLDGPGGTPGEAGATAKMRRRLSLWRGVEERAAAGPPAETASPELLAKLSHRLNKRLLEFPNPAMRSWFRLFSIYDRDQSGLVDWGEFSTMIRRDLRIKKKEMSDADLTLAWQAVDIDGGGRISAYEWAAFVRQCELHARNLGIEKIAADLMKALEKIPEPSMRSWPRLFGKYDKDGSQFIDQEEFTAMLRTDLDLDETDLSQDELAALWKAIDDNDSGMVNSEEFTTFMKLCEKQARKDEYEKNGYKPTASGKSKKTAAPNALPPKSPAPPSPGDKAGSRPSPRVKQ